MNKKEEIQVNYVLENILRNIEKPIFTYDFKYDHNEMLKKMKKNHLVKIV